MRRPVVHFQLRAKSPRKMNFVSSTTALLTALACVLFLFEMATAVSPAQTLVIPDYGKMPIRFEANQGQTNRQVKFLSRGSCYTLYLTASEAVISLRQSMLASDNPTTNFLHEKTAVSEEIPVATFAVLRMQLIGASPNASMMGVDELPGKVNFFVGNDPSRWQTQIPTYAKVRYREIYPGVDLDFYGTQGQLKYDFVVAPGKDPTAIRLAFKGTDRLSLDGEGNLNLQTEFGNLIQKAPVVYQEINGVRHTVAGSYVLFEKKQVGFQVGAYDSGKPLVIDPVVLIYSTYLGGRGADVGNGIAVDATGHAYIVGSTTSPNFPVSDDPFQQTLHGDEDVFVTKLNDTGSGIVYSTYIGGSKWDIGSDITIDEDGNAYVAGATLSEDFPTSNAFQPNINGIQDAFVVKLNSSGNVLSFSTFLGGSRSEFAYGIALDDANDVYVVGFTRSTDYPTVNPFQATNRGETDVFVSKMVSDGSGLVYSTYIGGEQNDGFLGIGALNGKPEVGCKIAVDHEGAATIAGTTVSDDFPMHNPLQANLIGLNEGFIAKFTSNGNALVFSTYLGNDENDVIRDVALDTEGNIYVVGQTRSENFPTTSGVFQDQHGGDSDAFVTKLSSDGDELVYSTFVGGSSADHGYGIAVDTKNNALITGTTESVDFPVQHSFQALSGGFDTFVTMLTTDGSHIVFSTYLGGERTDFARSIAIDKPGAAYITGYTESADDPNTPGNQGFPVANPYQNEFQGGAEDAFVVKIGPPDFPYEYTAKIVCGRQNDREDMRLARGFYATTINLHNPNDNDVAFFKKLALTYPPEEQKPGRIMPISTDALGPDEALKVDCVDLKKKLFPDPGGFPTPYIEGFIVIQSSQSLDVTAVYTTASLDNRGRVTSHSSIDVEQIKERNKKVELPDLIPLAPLPTPSEGGLPEGFPGILYCVKPEPAGGPSKVIQVIVKNQGLADAPATQTEIDFFEAGKFLIATPPLVKGMEAKLEFAIPADCYPPGFNTSCDFKITVDAFGDPGKGQVTESDENNNTAESFCVKPAG